MNTEFLADALFALFWIAVLWVITRNLEIDNEGESGHDRDPHE